MSIALPPPLTRRFSSGVWSPPPVAVWAWNAMIALVCGDTLVWKPSEKTPLTAIACHQILLETFEEFPQYPTTIANVVIGTSEVGQRLAASRLLPLISATGSTRM